MAEVKRMPMEDGEEGKAIQLLKSPALWNLGIYVSGLCSSRQAMPYCFPVSGSIMFGYRDPSVRPSNDQACTMRGPGPGSGIFASKSE